MSLIVTKDLARRYELGGEVVMALGARHSSGASFMFIWTARILRAS